MAWRRRARSEDEHEPERDTDHAPAAEPFAAGDGWEYLVEQAGPAPDRLAWRCNQLGADGWELAAALPLACLALGGGGAPPASSSSSSGG